MSTNDANGSSINPPEDPIGLDNEERLALVRGYQVDQIVAPPGHLHLRNPHAVDEMVQAIAAGDMGSLGDEPMLLNMWPREIENGLVRAWSVHCVDGTHRLAAGRRAEKWYVIGQIPPGMIRVWIEGMDSADPPKAQVRWIPLEVARESRIDDWVDVSDHPKARGSTAQIRADIANDSLRFRRHDRGVSLRRVREEMS